MRQFPGGYKKNNFDKQMDQKATKHMLNQANKFRAEMEAIQKQVDDELRWKELAEKMEKLNNLKAAG